jgi:type IV secretion system protein VirB4
MIKLLESVPNAMKPFSEAGKVDDIFRPRMLGHGIFATTTGYGVSFSVVGVDSEGLDRETLNYLSKQIATANRMLPEDCVVFEYQVTRANETLPARPITQEIVRQQAEERNAFLKANARFRSVRLFVTLYIPGKVADEANEFTQNARSALRRLQQAALIYEQQLKLFRVKRLTCDEVVQLYSYLLNLERPLMTAKSAAPGTRPKKLGRSHIGFDGEYFRVGKRYCQALAVIEPPRGTRPDLWGALPSIDCEMVWCSIWRRKPSKATRKEAAAVENALGMTAVDVFSAAVGGYSEGEQRPKRASDVAQEKTVETIGGVLADVNIGHYFGEWSLFGLVHSRDKNQIEDALPRIHALFSDPSEAGILEERRGARSAYMSFFPGQPYNVRKLWMRGDHKANVSFLYAPFLGHPYSDDLRDEYTLAYETRQGTPFYFTPFVNGNGSTTVVGAPRRGKSLNVNALFTAALKYGTKTFIFDQGESYESNVRAHGGSVTHLGLQYPRLNFFKQPATRENMFAVAGLIRMMLIKSGVTVEPEDLLVIERGVERLFSVEYEGRRLGHISLPDKLKKGLARWLQGGVYGGIFDNAEDDLEFNDLQLFDFANMDAKQNDLLEVEMTWILYLCQGVIRDKRNLGTPKHIVLDELWKRMGILPVVSFVLETIKADPKNLAWATLVTHSVEDLGTYAPLIKNACPTTIFLGGAYDKKLYKAHFGLNERELEELDSLGDRELAVKVDGEPIAYGGTGYFKVLRMSLDPAAYARATTKPSERALRDQLIEEHGQVEGMNKLTELAAPYQSGQ